MEGAGTVRQRASDKFWERGASWGQLALAFCLALTGVVGLGIKVVMAESLNEDRLSAMQRIHDQERSEMLDKEHREDVWKSALMEQISMMRVDQASMKSQNSVLIQLLSDGKRK